MVSEPGEEWNYHGGASHLLSAIITETTGRSAYEFAREFLFDPLNMTSVSWPPDPQGNSMGYSDLYISPRDMAKFGYLFLNNGSWEGARAVFGIPFHLLVFARAGRIFCIKILGM